MRRAVLVLLAAALAASPAAANSLASIVVERNGDIYFSDYVRDKIWKVSSAGELSVALARRHSSHLVLGANGAIYGEHRPDRGGDAEIWRLDPGRGTDVVFRTARYGGSTSYRGTVFTIDPAGRLLYMRDCQIVRLAADGGLEAIAGEPCHETAWRDPAVAYGHLHGSFAWGPGPALYFSNGRTIRVVRQDGSVATLSGQPASLFGAPLDGEPSFESVAGLAVDARGRIVVADRDRREILRIGRDGRAEVLARLGVFWSPIALTLSGDDVYLLVNLRFETPKFLSGVLGNPTLQRLTPDGHLATISSVRWGRSR